MADNTGAQERPTLHPLCTLFPPLAGKELHALADDIKANGLREPILRTPDGQVIDGQGRLAACELAGVSPHFAVWDGTGSLIDLVKSRNLLRRHLTQSQRASIAAKLLDILKNDGNFSRADLPAKRRGRLRDEVAQATGASGRLVEDAELVRHQGIPELIDAVDAGDLTVHRAKQIAKKPKRTQRKALKEARSTRRRKRKSLRKDNSVTPTVVGEATTDTAVAVPSTYTGPKFQYIFAPAPAPLSWWGSTTGASPETALELLRDTPIGDVATENAVMVFWCRNHFLGDALAMLGAAGWKYSTSIAVVMRSTSTVVARDHHSHLLIMTHGERPPRLELVPSVLYVDGSPKKFTPAVAQFVVGLIDARDVLQTWGESALPGWQMLADIISGDPTDDPGSTSQRHTLHDGTDDARVVAEGGSAGDEATE